MTAGGASTIHESFGLPYWLSSLILVLVILMTLFLKFERLITVLGMVTPFLVIVVSIIAIYYFITGDLNFSATNRFNKQHQSLSLGWWFDGLNYASLQIAPHLVFKCHGRSHAASSVWLMGWPTWWHHYHITVIND